MNQNADQRPDQPQWQSLSKLHPSSLPRKLRRSFAESSAKGYHTISNITGIPSHGVALCVSQELIQFLVHQNHKQLVGRDTSGEVNFLQKKKEKKLDLTPNCLLLLLT